MILFRKILLKFCLCGTLTLVSLSCGSNRTSGQELQLDGVIESFGKLQVFAFEPGIIGQLKVQCGDKVQKGQPIANLDDTLQRCELSVANKIANSIPLDAEERQGSEKRVHDAETKLERRCIRAPSDGVVLRVHRFEGEFASEAISLLELQSKDRVLAKFSLSESRKELFEVGKELFKVGNRLQVKLKNGKTCLCKVSTVESRVNDLGATLDIKLLIDNSDYSIKIGEACTLQLTIL